MTSELHHEISPRDAEWYREQADELAEALRSGDAEASARAREALGDEGGDARAILASEHGFGSWEELVRFAESGEPDRHVGRIGSVVDVPRYEDRARQLVAELLAGDRDALARVQAHLPRASGLPEDDLLGSELPLRDAKVVVAHEYGFPTWRDLELYVRKAVEQGEAERRWEAKGDVALAIDALMAGDAGRLRELIAANRDLLGPCYRGMTLLEVIGQPGVFGRPVGKELGVDRGCVEVLIELGSSLDVPLLTGACFDRLELVRLLMEAGADVETDAIWGITPLLSAIYNSAGETAELLASKRIVPYALWVVAALGRIDLMEGFFDEDGRLKPEAGAHRPNLPDVGWPPGPPPREGDEAILEDAFHEACHNGRTEAAAWLLDRGVDLGSRGYANMTALHYAALGGHAGTARFLLERGIDPGLKDDLHGTALDLAREMDRQYGRFGPVVEVLEQA